MKESEILEILERHFAASNCFTTRHLRTQTGYIGTPDEDTIRYVDFFVMKLWPSDGFLRMAFEVKSNRSDWQKELRNPVKRSQISLLCHEFYFVVGPNVINKADELNIGLFAKIGHAGLIEISENEELLIHRKAGRNVPWPMPETFVASLLRAAKNGKHHKDANDQSGEGA